MKELVQDKNNSTSQIKPLEKMGELRHKAEEW